MLLQLMPKIKRWDLLFVKGIRHMMLDELYKMSLFSSLSEYKRTNTISCLVENFDHFIPYAHDVHHQNVYEAWEDRKNKTHLSDHTWPTEFLISNESTFIQIPRHRVPGAALQHLQHWCPCSA